MVIRVPSGLRGQKTSFPRSQRRAGGCFRKESREKRPTPLPRLLCFRLKKKAQVEGGRKALRMGSGDVKCDEMNEIPNVASLWDSHSAGKFSISPRRRRLVGKKFFA